MCESRDVQEPIELLQSRFDKLSGVFDLTQLLARAGDEAEICEAAIRLLAKALPSRRAAILLFDADGVMRFKAWLGLSEQYRQAATGHSPWRPEEANATALIVPDVAADPAFALLWPAFAAESIAALCFVPLRAGGRLLGKFMVYGDRAGDPVGQDLPLVCNIADHVAIAVARTHSEQERRRCEQELLRTQRIESIGRLAGGVAHDFNNLLTVIIGNAEMAAIRAAADPEASEALAAIRSAAGRAAALTAQLLAFARRQRTPASQFDLDRLIDETEPLLRRLIGDRIDLTISCCRAGAVVSGDPGRLQQVLVNLALNARDAMPDGGRIEITTALSGDAQQRTVVLTVRDDGIGIDAATRAHLFEPFFTTKEFGRGSGLGLASSYGTVQHSGGSIEVESEPGAGATFKIRLPLAGGGASVDGLAAPEAAAGRAATILLVEDDELLREFASSLLTSHGFRVLAAADGPAALELVGRHRDRIDLALTDVVMPTLGGQALADRLREVEPRLEVVLMSGFAPDAALRDGDRSYLPKPFTAAQLLATVRRRITRQGAGSSG